MPNCVVSFMRINNVAFTIFLHYSSSKSDVHTYPEVSMHQATCKIESIHINSPFESFSHTPNCTLDIISIYMKLLNKNVSRAISI